MSSAAVVVVPPEEVAERAAEGLALRRRLPKSRRCCTPVGIRRAVQLKNRQPMSIQTVRRMVSYFARHEVDKQGEGWGQDSKGYQAWLLWGGDVGWEWAQQVIEDYESGRLAA